MYLKYQTVTINLVVEAWSLVLYLLRGRHHLTSPATRFQSYVRASEPLHSFLIVYI